MAGQWQRDFFLITEDPFAVDLNTLDLWVEGLSVREATERRWRDTNSQSPLQVTGSLAHQGSSSERENGMALLAQDCAQQYEAFEFLEEALTDPIHFIDFCPVQLTRAVRKVFVRKYYSLDNHIVREILRQPHILNVKLQGGGDRRAMFEVDQIARASEQRSMKVCRIIMNLQRVGRWIEHATQRHGEDEIPYPGGRLHVPEMEALQEPLCWRYRSLIFVLLAKFDLSSKLSKTLQTEHIEDVAAILLAIGGLPEPTDRSRLLPILRGDEVLTTYSAASTLRQSVLDGNVREQLQQLDKHVLRRRFDDFKAILVQELEQRGEQRGEREMNERLNQSQQSLPGGSGGGSAGAGVSGGGISTGALPDESRVGGLVGAGMTFFRGGRLGKLKSSKLDPMVAALTAGVVTLHSVSEFSSFFGFLAEFVEKLRQFDAVDPLDVFQRCYTAMETLAERDRTEDRKRNELWPGWLEAWCKFLEFYRACAACLLSSSQPLPHPTHGSRELDPGEQGAVDVSEESSGAYTESAVRFEADASSKLLQL